MHLATQQEIQDCYKGQEAAAKYVEQRFDSELMKLLHERQVAAVQRVFDTKCPERSLEIAPGPGRVTRDLRPGGELICIDFNDGMISEGREACSNGAHWMQGDAFNLPFTQEFQFSYSYRFIRHFHRSDRDRLYHEIRKVLCLEGTLTFDAVNEQVSAPLREKHPEEYPIYDKVYRDESELTTELRQNGFEVLRIEPVQRWYSMQYRAQVLLGPRSRWLCRRAIRLFEVMRRGPALEWIVTCRRV